MNLIHLKLGVIARMFPGRGEAFYTDGLEMALPSYRNASSLRLNSMGLEDRKADCYIASLAKTDNKKSGWGTKPHPDL